MRPSASPARWRAGSSSACGRSSPWPGRGPSSCAAYVRPRWWRAASATTPREQLVDPLVVGLGDHRRPLEPALPRRRLLLEDVARVGAPTAQLALGGLAEPLLGAGMGLHLRHRSRLLKQTSGLLNEGDRQAAPLLEAIARTVDVVGISVEVHDLEGPLGAQAPRAVVGLVNRAPERAREASEGVGEAEGEAVGLRVFSARLGGLGQLDAWLHGGVQQKLGGAGDGA